MKREVYAKDSAAKTAKLAYVPTGIDQGTASTASTESFGSY